MSLYWSCDNASGSKVVCCGSDGGVEDSVQVFHKNNTEKPRHCKESSLKDRKKQKRFRSAFTTTQVAILENEFKKNPYVTNVQRQQVANTLGLPERSVKIWFQNRRMKEKRGASRTVENEKSFNDTEIEDKLQIMSDDDSTDVLVKEENSKDLNDNLQYNSSPMNRYTSTDKIVHVIPDKSVTINAEAVNKDSQRKLVLPTERNLNVPRQPIGHILPFSQNSTPLPQRSPENLSVSPKEQNQKLGPKAEESQTAGYYPLDLSKYYSSVPAVNHVPNLPWSRYNFIPVVPSGAQNVPSFPTETPPVVSPATKCTCNCHAVNPFDGPRYQSPYPLIYTQYIPHIVAPMPTQTDKF